MEDKYYVWVLRQVKPGFDVVGVFANISDLDDYVRGDLLPDFIEWNGTNYDFRVKEIFRPNPIIHTMYRYTITFYDCDTEFELYTDLMPIR